MNLSKPQNNVLGIVISRFFFCFLLVENLNLLQVGFKGWNNTHEHKFVKSSFDSFVTYRHRIVKQLPTNKTCKSGPGHPPAGGWHDCQAPPVEVGSLSLYLPGFFKHPRWCRISGNQQYIILQEPAKSFFTTAIACLWDSLSRDYIIWLHSDYNRTLQSSLLAWWFHIVSNHLSTLIGPCA